MDETAVTKNLDLRNRFLMDDAQCSKICGMKDRFTFIPFVSPFGPLQSFRPCVIIRGQASKWKNAPRKQSAKIANPSFQRDKPVSPKNIDFHHQEYRDFPVKGQIAIKIKLNILNLTINWPLERFPCLFSKFCLGNTPNNTARVEATFCISQKEEPSSTLSALLWHPLYNCNDMGIIWG